MWVIIKDGTTKVFQFDYMQFIEDGMVHFDIDSERSIKVHKNKVQKIKTEKLILDDISKLQEWITEDS